ncbi:transcriptional regulator HexR [Litorivicinus lipolyticus]|uniref:Transcriptional regulator HexR n=1 Tax=Litorivicinus lipolyticus TaxID=418701 RepID=A0A5Q2QFM4_9GAMM|nr:transcriptional regulator HexR [Litorivicinus lipolyticus]QGG79795.1 transcriptional regulator HexR [Litorivicinus lipolyticus]
MGKARIEVYFRTIVRERSVLDRIQQQKDGLNRSEKKVAEVILQDPQAAIRSSIAALAKLAGVSEPTVNRFCRSFDAKGFPDFKLALAQSLASGTPYVSQVVDPDDSASEYSDKIFAASSAALEKARRQLAPSDVEKAVDMLIQARQILFFGMGASAAVAQDAQHKFFRFNIPVLAYSDSLMQRMHSAALHTGDVVVAISHTGRTRGIVSAAKIAREAGAHVLALTLDGSPLSKVASLTLSVEPPENTDIYLPMVSRLVQLTLLDVLATGVILKRGPDFAEHLLKVKNAIRDTRLSDIE